MIANNPRVVCYKQMKARAYTEQHFWSFGSIFFRFVYEPNEVWCAVACVMLQVLMRCCLFVHTVGPKLL